MVLPLIDGHDIDLDAFESDLKKVDFSTENMEFKAGAGYMSYPCGYMQLANGMPCLFVNAGGDWECPICFVIYWDGKKLRAYIPKAGNMWNRDTKTAFGSDNYKDETERLEMIQEFLNEVEDWDPEQAKKLKADLQAQIDEDGDDADFEGYFENIDVSNHDAILKDVQARIMEK